VFNAQYGLPTDNYLVIPRDGLAKLIDAVGGVDMQLAADITVDEITYQKGVRTLPGKVAVYYAVEYNYNNTPASDLERMQRQRQLFASLIDRLSDRSLEDLYNTDPARKDVLSNVILGADPIRYDTTSFGKARLMGVNERQAEKKKQIEAMAQFLFDVSHIDFEDITFCTLPGTAQKRGTGYVYSVNKAQTVKLLNEYMNPHGLTIDDTTVAVTELKANPANADTAVTTLDKVLVKAAQ
jgi:anionic cell wall polymer biosynthesis LytR-Cps2A-Psr (LCP) family protein